MTNNANSTISALQVITEQLLNLSEKELSKEDLAYLKGFQTRIPPLNFGQIENHKVLVPAKSWERINNTEVPQLYPVYPWGIYGIGKPDLETALNTWKYDTDAIKFRSHIGWKQDNIFAARLGLTNEAAKYNLLKMANSERRFPAFWGPGFDWVPDHNWGGCRNDWNAGNAFAGSGWENLSFSGLAKRLECAFQIACYSKHNG